MTYETALDALGDGTRRAILENLRRAPAQAGEIAERFPISRPAVSQHLRVLREAGLVSVRKDGTRSIYSIDPAGLRDLRRYLERFWDDALGSFKDAVERAIPPKKGKRRHER